MQKVYKTSSIKICGGQKSNNSRDAKHQFALKQVCVITQKGSENIESHWHVNSYTTELSFIQRNFEKSSAVYVFTCQCDSGYVGRATQRLEDRIKQHVPSNIRNKTHPQREQPPRSCKSKITTKTCDSAIGQHLPENPDCAKNYNGDMFRIIGKARSSFHLAVLESIYISTNKPLLCRQKEFVFILRLHW